LARRLFALETLILRVGKAWISLDSLVRNETYQWVTRVFPEFFFLTAFVVEKDPSERRPRSDMRKKRSCSWSQLTLISDFLQDSPTEMTFVQIVLTGASPTSE
jgi:hypothetical protein